MELPTAFAVFVACAFVAVVLPCTNAGSFAVSGFLFAAFCCRMDRDLSTAGWLLLVEIPLAGIFYGLGRFTRAIVARARDV